MSAFPLARSAAARICSHAAQLPSPCTLQKPLSRCLASPIVLQRWQSRRTYISPSQKQNAAHVNLDTEIRLGKEHFISETGKQPTEVRVPSGIDPDTMVSPTTGGCPIDSKLQYCSSLNSIGILKHATIMDQGTRPIYLDMQSTTPTDPRVVDAMLPYMTGLFGNPHSRTHAYGWEAEEATDIARAHVANLIGANPKEVIFTSGATESNNMSIKGVARFYNNAKRHIITSQTEHKCVLDSCRHLQDEGFDVTYLPVMNNGLINLEDLEKAIRKDTSIVSIMTVNNEIGVIQPMEEIGKICRKHKVFFHTDAAQAVGKIPIDVNKWNVDLMSISGHKLYGPKGIGACFVRRRPRVRIEPLISGGGQERGLRSGTLAPHQVVGFGEACRIAQDELLVKYTLFFRLYLEDLSHDEL